MSPKLGNRIQRDKSEVSSSIFSSIDEDKGNET